MSRFFFDTDDGHRRVIDDEGLELPSVDAARREAVAVLPEMMRERLPEMESTSFTCVVRDEANTIVYTVSLAFVGARINSFDIDARIRNSVAQVWGASDATAPLKRAS